MTLKDGLLTLEGVRDDLLFFSDRPDRIVGRESLEDFIEAWDEGEESFATIPPNAVLTILRDRDALDLVVVLKEPTLTERTLVYRVEVLDGPESGSGYDAALFIDAFGGRLRELGKNVLEVEAQHVQALLDVGGDRGTGGRRERSVEGRRANSEPRRIHRGPGDPDLPRDPGYNEGAEIR